MGEKLRVRLPTDEGPNPYDSATPPQMPDWLTLGFWLKVIPFAVVMGVTAWWKSRH
jgi:hypothetical protein